MQKDLLFILIIAPNIVGERNGAALNSSSHRRDGADVGDHCLPVHRAAPPHQPLFAQGPPFAAR